MTRAALAIVAVFASIFATAETNRTATENWTRNRIAAATNGLATAADVESKADKSALDDHLLKTNPHEVTAEQVGAVQLVEDSNGAKTAVTIGTRISGGTVGQYSLANGHNATASGYCSHAEGFYTTASEDYSHADGYYAHTKKQDRYAFAWNGDESRTTQYYSHGKGTFNINPVGGAGGFYIGEQTLSDVIFVGITNNMSADSPTFSNAVLAVGLNIDTNSVAVLGEIAETFGGFPIEGTATTVGGLLAALAAAVAWLKKNKVQTLKLGDNSVETSADGGVAKLDDFFTESNSLLNGRLAYSRNATGLKDRAFNALTFDGTEYNLSTALAAVTPTASGQPRDLLIVATATAATTISFTAGTIKGDKPTIDGAGTWLITLTEYASGVWYCRQIKMEDAA